MAQATGLTRRTFLKVGAAAGGGLAIGLYLPSYLGMSEETTAASEAFEPNVWIQIGTDDTVTITLTQLEMGQGVMTSMPMLIAEELDMDWQKLDTVWAPADPVYGNPGFGGSQSTAGSRSVRGMWKLFREAGATGRAMLVTAASQTWGVPENECSSEKGEVIHSSTGRRLKYGQLVEKASTLPVPEQVTLKNFDEFHLLGQSLARLDIPEKVNGSAVYGIDISRPNMLVARVVRCPVFGGKVKSFNADKAKAVPGVRHVIQISSGISVIADNYWAATKGVQALEIQWDEGPLAELSSADISKQLAELGQKTGAVARSDGDFTAAMSGASRTFEATYEVPYLAHACMEPMNCTADVRADGCDVWVSTQSQTSTHRAAIEITGLPPDAVKVHTPYLGGGFGRRGQTDFVADAVESSKAVGRPVKVIWTREDDIQHDYYRPVSYARFWAALDESGMPVAWMQRLVQPSLRARDNPRALDAAGGVDRNSMEGAADLPYNIPNVRVEYVRFEPGIPVGYWRSVGNSVNGYVTESFLDEIAVTAGKDPFELRRQLLDKAPRHKAALELACENAGWGKPLPSGRARGISVHESFGSIIAQVAEVSVGRDGEVRVHRVTAAVDCGWIINPDTIKAQIESGIVYGLTALLKGEILIDRGRVVQSNFHDYDMLRMNEMPEIDVHIVPSTEPPGGMGEPGTPPIFSAVVNAIYAATGKRIRRLPIRPAELSMA